MLLFGVKWMVLPIFVSFHTLGSPLAFLKWCFDSLNVIQGIGLHYAIIPRA